MRVGLCAADILWLREKEPSFPCIMAVIGCGGKTSWIASLAKELSHKKVLITPTTRIYPMLEDEITLCTTVDACEKHIPHVGIQCLGIREERSGKLTALPPSLLCEQVKKYDVVLLEADGSRGLPCKGWLDTEPVIPSFCTHTIGIVTLQALGQRVSKQTVLHLPEFKQLTGNSVGERITGQALTKMLCAPGGMFEKAVGKNYLFVNQIESDMLERKAKEWLMEVKEQYPHKFTGFTYGSVVKNCWQEV
ncbi:MAG: selenium cofactor biosynthesis protein YqeC [Lachnospiraceae bacterium]